jgi:phage tail sheath protein FI
LPKRTAKTTDTMRSMPPSLPQPHKALCRNLALTANTSAMQPPIKTVNAFMRTLIARGALVDGECVFDSAKNPETEIAQGKLLFDFNFMPPVPMERVRFESFVDISLLKF